MSETSARTPPRDGDAHAEQGVLEAFFQHSQTSLVLLNRSFDFVRVNEAYARACMRPVEYFPGRNHFELYPSALIEDFRRVVEEKKQWSIAARPFVFPDHPEWGTTYWDLALVPILDAAGEVEHLVFSLHDVTPIVRAEEALRESEARYRQLFELSPVAIVIHDGERYLHANGTAAALLGYENAEQLVGVRVDAIVHPDDRASVRRRLESLHRQGAITTSADVRVVRRDGTFAVVQASAAVCEYGGRRATQVILTDLTERRRLEQELRQAQKMESIGRLAGGIAHDFNNLLTVINGYAEMALRAVGDDAIRADIAEVRNAGERAAALTRQLLAFSRRQVLQPARLRVHDVLCDVERMLRRVLPEDIELSVSAARERAEVFVDRGQLDQVVMNLVVNARDAMPNGGRLELASADVEIDEAEAARLEGILPGRYVRLVVRDTGVGMDAATKAHLFEPFFTTKDVGKGTGLGLATVYGIVRQSGGAIVVHSEPGCGATFEVYLPVFGGQEDALAQPPSPPKEQVGGRETILLVEDEAAVRSVVQRALVSAGYVVLTAADATEALRIAEAKSAPLHLLITDVIMPHVRGTELAARIVAARPEAKVLFMSGYVDEERFERDQLGAGASFLAKPIRLEALLRKVRETLDGPRRAGG